MALYFYGFGGAEWPTLDETARTFAIGSRERVRQILAVALASLRTPPLQAIRRASRLVRSRPFWEARELGAAIAAKTGDRSDLGVRALLGLIHELGLARRHQAYDHNLERLTRAQLSSGQGYVLAHAEMIGPLHWALFGARRLSLRLGLVSAACLSEKLGHDAPVESLKTLLRLDPASWMSSEDKEFWWARETAENTLVTLAAKAFAVIDHASPAHLAEGLYNALRVRTRGERAAGCAEVQAWIEGSRRFARAEGRVVFVGRGEKLSEPEHELASYLSRSGSADFPAIKAFLQSRGVGASTIAKTATQSPFVYIDRRAGPRAFRYRLVGSRRDEEGEGTTRSPAPAVSSNPPAPSPSPAVVTCSASVAN